MKRPLRSLRPIGPFISLNRGFTGLNNDISEFDKIEIHVRDPEKDTRYEVIGIFLEPTETIGVAVHTNAITINGETSFAIFDLEEPFEEITPSGAELTAAENEKIGIKEADTNLVNIIIS